MSIRPADLLLCAQRAMSINDAGEAEFRACISRAYYAAFHDSKKWHENLLAPGSMGTTNHPMGVHETLVVQLQNPTTIPDELKRRSKRRAYCLRALRDRRVEADYKLDLNVDVHMASQAVSDSDAILNIS
mgnify:FL=1